MLVTLLEVNELNQNKEGYIIRLIFINTHEITNKFEGFLIKSISGILKIQLQIL